MVRKGMLQLWDDLEHVADGLGITYSVRNVKPATTYEFDATGLVNFQGKGPRVIRSNSTYYRAARKITMNFQRDFTPAYKAAIFAHEMGHHISQVVYGNRFSSDPYSTSRQREEVRASLHAYELLYQLTKGRVPAGCVDMLNISLASYVGKEEQL